MNNLDSTSTQPRTESRELSRPPEILEVRPSAHILSSYTPEPFQHVSLDAASAAGTRLVGPAHRQWNDASLGPHGGATDTASLAATSWKTSHAAARVAVANKDLFSWAMR